MGGVGGGYWGVFGEMGGIGNGVGDLGIGMEGGGGAGGCVRRGAGGAGRRGAAAGAPGVSPCGGPQYVSNTPLLVFYPIHSPV